MKHPSIEIDELLARWLSGEADAETIERLQQWIQYSDENARYAAQFEQLWNAAEDQTTNIDMNRAWDKIQHQRNHSYETPVRKIKSYYYWTAAAAAIAILLVAWNLFQRDPSRIPTDEVATKSIQLSTDKDTLRTILEDGTIVVLQPHSQLTVDTAFGRKHRTVTLVGNAWFKTKHLPGAPFTVRNQKTKIVDIGTAFHVNTLEKNLQVIVTEGSVKVLTQQDKSLLFKGDTAKINGANGHITTATSEPIKTSESINNKILVFNKTELKKVVQLLNNTYACKIKIANSALENCKLTASFKNEDIDVVLDVIRETFNLEIRRESNIIYLEGTGCQ
jgi:transmembrane sensor